MTSNSFSFFDGKVTLYNDDCLKILDELPENSVDSVVTDPPYELSNDGKNSPVRVFTEFVFPKNSDGQPLFSGDCQFSFLLNKIFDLGRRWIIPGPSSTMPKGSMTFNKNIVDREPVIENITEPSEFISNRNTVDDSDSEDVEYLGTFAFELADSETSIAHDILNRSGTTFFSGSIGIGLGISTSSLPTLLSRFGTVVIRNEDIRLCDNPCSSFIRTGGTTEHFSVPRFYLGGRSIESFTTIGALKMIAVLDRIGAKFVRADTRTRSLSSKFQTCRVSVVDVVTNRTLAFDLVIHPVNISSVGFMGKEWDGSKIVFSVELWQKVMRVLKPGGYLLAFGAAKNYHRMAVAIEDAGFELRDTIMWLYGSGFPKSYNTAQSIEKLLTTGKSRRPDRKLGLSRNRFSGSESGTLVANTGGQVELTTREAKQWDGWGTALKPAFEPIIMARKPLSEKTVAANVLEWGVGGININDCRVPTTEEISNHSRSLESSRSKGKYGDSKEQDTHQTEGQKLGRFPANLIHDGSDEVETEFAKYGESKDGVSVNRNRDPSSHSNNKIYGKRNADTNDVTYGGSGTASRFFYSAKASKKDRAGSKHPTVKPLSLMQYLVTLVTPSNGTVLDPFAGSGTTGQAAFEKGFNVILIEREQEYADDITNRLNCLKVENKLF